MIYVLQGALKVLVGGETAAVHEGEVLLVPAGVRHQAEDARRHVRDDGGIGAIRSGGSMTLTWILLGLVVLLALWASPPTTG